MKINQSLLFWAVLFVFMTNCEKGLFRAPNNTADGAYQLADGELAEDHFAYNEQYLYYSFELPQPCIAKIVVEKAPGPYGVEVFNGLSEQKMMASTGWIGKGPDFTLWAGPLGQGEHLVRVVRANYQDSLFRFKVVYDCSDKTELNNFFNQATPLTAGVAQEGWILAVNNYNDLEDADIYKFEVVGRPAVARIEYKAPNRIYPSNASIAVSAYDFANENSRLDQILNVEQSQIGGMLLGPLTVGTHYVALNYEGQCNCQSDEPYQITVHLDYTDAQEPNDLPFENATPMVIDRQYEGMLAFPNSRGEADQDWFKFVPTSSDNYQLQLIGVPNDYRAHCWIYVEPPGNNNHVSYIYAEPGGSQSTNNMALNAGTTYWFKIAMATYWHESLGTYKVKLIQN